jgi:hypothetical protein
MATRPWRIEEARPSAYAGRMPQAEVEPMPAPVKESRLPELRLPRIDPDQIVRAFSEIKLPEFRAAAPEVPKIEPPTADAVKKAIDDAAVRVGLRQPRRSSRLALFAGIAIVAGLLVYALTRPSVRGQVDRSTRKARERIDEMRRQREVAVEPEDIAEPVAIEAWTDQDVEAPVPVASRAGGTGTDEFGRGGDGIPAFEESESTNPV